MASNASWSQVGSNGAETMETGEEAAAAAAETPGQPSSGSVPQPTRHVRSASSLAESLGKLVDMKAESKLPQLKTEADWQEARFRLENLFVLLGVDEVVAKAEKGAMMDLEPELQTDEQRQVSKFLYSLLVACTSGPALTIVRLVTAGDGLHAWRNLCREYQPQVALRRNAMLSAILQPKWKIYENN